MNFVGKTQIFLENISSRLHFLDEQLRLLFPVVIEPGYSKAHTLLSWQTKGKAHTIVGESSHWPALHIVRRECQVPTSTQGVSVRIPYNQHEWEACEDSKNLEDLVYLALEEALRERLLQLCLYGESSGTVVVREGLLNLKSASRLALDPVSASLQDLVEGILKAKDLSVQAGARHANGFRLLVPLALERKLQQFYNPAGTLTAKEYLQDKYGLQVTVSELVDKLILLPADSQEAYFHRFNDIKVSLKAIDPHCASLTYFGSVAGAWLVLSQAKRIVYLTK